MLLVRASWRWWWGPPGGLLVLLVGASLRPPGAAGGGLLVLVVGASLRALVLLVGVDSWWNALQVGRDLDKSARGMVRI